MISQEHGEYLLNIAKKAVKTYLETGEQILVPEDCPEELKEKLGVFVTLNKNNQLRGCIGYPEPIESAIQATISVAIAAASEDPRFPHVIPEEYDNLEFEVTVLTKPQLMEIAHPSEYLNNIKIGKDGLMIKKGYSKGLLLPQVATENNFDVETFLEHTCMKAGISADSYLDESCDVYTFQGQILNSDNFWQEVLKACNENKDK